jgi:hypothetical protein
LTRYAGHVPRLLSEACALAAHARGRKIALGRSVLTDYVKTPPSPQNALDAFAGTWASRFPPPYEGLRAGTTRLFEDLRVEWAINELGGVDGKTILELGPLEGAHTFMLERHGAASIVAVEGNRGAYLRCLITKELLSLERSRFLCGDFLAYLQSTSDTYDLCFASGVLYHVQNPVELIALIAARAESLFMWTHYYDEANVPTRGGRPRVVPVESAEYRGFEHRRYRYRYGLSLLWRGFCGGSAPFAHWLTREDLLGALEHFGWTSIQIGFDEPQHPNGPALALVARRS